MSDTQRGDSISFEFDLNTFRLSAIKKAAYRFMGGFIVTVDQLTESRARVTLLSCHTLNQRLDPATLPNEVLDQELRETVAEETKSIRELLLAQAFSGLSLLDPVGETADYRDDPLHIADPQRTTGATDDSRRDG